MSFIVYTAGRSRTQWLSKFLSYGDQLCHFEMAAKARSFADVRAFFAHEGVGTAETSAAPAWRLIHHYFPNLKRVVVLRPEDEIVASLIAALPHSVKIDQRALRLNVANAVRCLRQISELPDTLTVHFSELNQERVCAEIFEHCLAVPFDREWWLKFCNQNIQKNVMQFVLDLDCNAIRDLQRSCRAEFRALARSGAMRKRGHLCQSFPV